MNHTFIKAVIFDGGGVFSLAADAGGERYWECKLGLEPGGIRKLIGPERNSQANLGLISEEDVWERALAPLKSRLYHTRSDCDRFLGRRIS